VRDSQCRDDWVAFLPARIVPRNLLFGVDDRCPLRGDTVRDTVETMNP
jgi:hypothetical protein